MSQDLFRQEALQYSASAKYGEPVIYQPLTLKVFGIVFCSLLFVFFVYALNANLKETELVTGYLTPVDGEVKVYSSRQGIVVEAYVQESQHVQKGDVLAVLKDARYDESGTEADGALIDMFREREVHLQDEIVLSQERAGILSDQIEDRLVAARQELNFLIEELGIASENGELAAEELEDARTLYKNGQISKVDYNRKRTQHLSAIQVEKSAALRIHTQESAIDDLKKQLQLQPLSARADILEQQQLLIQLQSQRKELETKRMFTITASASGIVTNFMSSEGDLVITRAPLLSILPEDYTLEANLYVPARAIGLIEPGQEVMISYDAFPFESYGNYVGQVSQIGKALIDPREHLLPTGLGDPVYLVKAKLMQQHVQDKTKIGLQSGMSLSAEVITDTKTLLEKLVSPLTSLGKKV